MSEPRAPPPSSAFVAFHYGSYWCSKCPRKTRHLLDSLMRRHWTFWRESVQSMWTGHSSTASGRGRYHHGPLGAPTAAAGVAGAENGTAAPTPGARAELPQLQLPTDFTKRIRLLLGNTSLHIPSSCRLRMIAATAQCWQGMACVSDDCARLKEGRRSSYCPLYLLASVPRPGWPSASPSGRRVALRIFSDVPRATRHSPQSWQEEETRCST